MGYPSRVSRRGGVGVFLDLTEYETSTEASERVVNKECDNHAMTSPKTQDAHATSTSVVSIKVPRLVTSTKIHSTWMEHERGESAASWYKMHQTGRPRGVLESRRIPKGLVFATHLQQTQPQNHGKQHSCTHELALCKHVSLDVTAHGDCNSTADVPSFTLRSVLSAIPFVSDLCGVLTPVTRKYS